MIKTRTMKVKCNKNQEIMAITMIKPIITTVILTIIIKIMMIMMIIRIKIGNRIKI